RDQSGRQRVVVINEALAHRDFASEDPIGQTAFIGRDPMPWEIVGVVDNIREFSLDREVEPQFFIDMRQWPASSPLLIPTGAYYALRLERDSAAIVPVIRSIVRQADTSAALFHVAPMEQLLSSTIAVPRANAVIMSVFGGIGLLLAVVGVAGVV